MRAPRIALCAVVGCAVQDWPTPVLRAVTPDTTRGAIVGTVVQWSDGQPLASPQLSVQSEDASATGPSSQVAMDSGGVFAIPSLAPGKYRVVVRALGYLPIDTSCLVQGGRVDTLVLMLDVDVIGRPPLRPAHDRFARLRPRLGSC